MGLPRLNKMAKCQNCNENEGESYDCYAARSYEQQVGYYEDGTPKREFFYRDATVKEAVVCDSCIEEDHLRRVASKKKWLMIFVVITAALIIPPALGMFESYIFGIISALITVLIFFSYQGTKGESGETKGDYLAIDVSRKELNAEHFDSYFTTQEFHSLRSDNRITLAIEA